SFRAISNVRMLDESNSPQAINTAIFPFASPGRLDRSSCVAGSTAWAPAPRPAPPPPLPCRAPPGPGAAPPRPRPPLPSPGGRLQFVLRLAVAAIGTLAMPEGIVSGAILKFGADMRTIPLTPAPFGPAISGCAAYVLTGPLPAESAHRKMRF